MTDDPGAATAGGDVVVLREGGRPEGRPTHAVVPWPLWQAMLRLREEQEDAEDAAAATAKLADPDREMIPAEVAHAVMDGVHPVRAWRLARGLSQDELARAAGVATETVSRIETGKRKGTARQMADLAHALRISLDTLMATL